LLPAEKHLPAVLLLEDGTLFHGAAIGKTGTTTGEICFNTGMTGYQEIFTDPSYFGQILVATNPHIGNYGTSPIDIESSGIKIAGLVCKKFNVNFSRKSADLSVQKYFEDNNVTGISEVDTRQLVRHVRENGAMNAIISSEIFDIPALREILSKVPNMEGLELSSRISTNVPYYYGNPSAKYNVAVLDLGVKKNILDCLTRRDCYVRVYPAKTSYKEMKRWNPDGFLISNGPGDPAVMGYAVDTVKTLLNQDEKLFGICLGHQMLAEACGLTTFKMHNGHRGLNHPVKNVLTGHCEITSQNHGFAVDANSIKNSDLVNITHINLNDQTIEGISVKGKNAFSVQYHPEASPGPHDSRYLFDDFVKMMDQ
jgi:carbamoyl-phosphate synthase small subunit